MGLFGKIKYGVRGRSFTLFRIVAKYADAMVAVTAMAHVDQVAHLISASLYPKGVACHQILDGGLDILAWLNIQLTGVDGVGIKSQ